MMARIRTIKPEFPQSESMGNVSRDARLLFIELWTIADDSGRLRGASRMLASLLFPYDLDAPGLIDTWLGELDKEGCIVRYRHETGTYIQICNWLSHQKIDKPSQSKLPPFDESSRILSNPLESSALDLRIKEGIKDQGSGSEERARIEQPATSVVVRTFDTSPGSGTPEHALFQRMRDAFLTKTPTGFPNAAGEIDALRWMVEACFRAWPDDPVLAAEALTRKFYDLTNSTDKFWKSVAFLPSKMKIFFVDVIKACEIEQRSAVDLNDVSWIEEVAK